MAFVGPALADKKGEGQNGGDKEAASAHVVDFGFAAGFEQASDWTAPITLFLVVAREAKPTVAIQPEFQMDCFVAALLAMTSRV